MKVNEPTDYEKVFEVDGGKWGKKIQRMLDGSYRFVTLWGPKDESSIEKKKEMKMSEQDVNANAAGPAIDFPQLDDMVLEAQQADVVEDTKKTAVKMAFIGGGQGGCKIADTFYKNGYRRVLLVNTTAQDMAGLECKNQLIIGQVAGAGKNPEAGKKAAQEHREDILRAMKKALGNDVEHIIVCVGSGGGTGTGSCEVLVSVAKDFLKSINKDPKVGVLVTQPKKAEGAAVIDNSTKLLGSLFGMVDEKQISPLMVFDNQKILQMFPKASIAEFFNIANKNMVGLFDVFNQLCAQASPYSSLDVADYKTILNSGTVVFGMTPLGAVENDTAIAEAIEKNVKRGLFSEALKVEGATHAGGILVASKAALAKIPQSAFDAAFETLGRVLGGKGLILHSGIYEGGDNLGDKVLLYTIVGGLK